MFGFKRWRFARRVRTGVALVGLAVLTSASGCGTTGAANEELIYPVGPEGTEWYVEEETKVAHSNFVQEPPDDVLLASAPRTIADRSDDVVRELSLGEVIHIALMNNSIVQTGVQAPVGNKQIFQAGDNIASIYDQAINETGVLFGRRGVEAALSDFDATWRSTMTWGRSRAPQNSLATLGATSIAETWNYSSSLTKQFATGGSLQVFNNWSYLGSNSPGVLFPSSYTGNSGFRFRQPLLAGGGVEFTRIAGPVNPNFGAITGVSQGVVIARINSDISLANFEASVRNSIRDVQKAYWALYLSYRNYETSVIAHRSAHQTWKESKIKFDVGTLKAADESQAREQLYATQASVEQSLNALYKAETALRRLMGLQLNDGEVIRPSDEPMVAAFLPDWQSSLAEALTRRVELRRQKWNIKSLQFQLRAASNLTQPQFDFVGGAQLNGFGDDFSGGRNDGITTRNLGSGVDTLFSGDYGAWSAGFEMSIPLGYRSATAQVRNYELRVAKARAVLSQMEREIAHDVTTAIQDVTAGYTSAATNEKRLVAARRRVELLDLEREEGTTTLDLVLRAQTSLAQAQSQYYSRVVDFTNAVIDLEFAKGSLLASSGVQLAEGAWDCDAYHDAYRRAMERTNGVPNEHLQTYPEEFATPTMPNPPGVSPMHIDIPETLLEGYPAEPEPIIEPGFQPSSPADIPLPREDRLPSGEPAPLPPGWEPKKDEGAAFDLFQDEPKTPELPDVADAMDDMFFFGGDWQPTVGDRDPKPSDSFLQLSHQTKADGKKTEVGTADFEVIEFEENAVPKPKSAKDWKHIPGPFKAPASVKQLKPQPLPPRTQKTAPLRFEDLFRP